MQRGGQLNRMREEEGPVVEEEQWQRKLYYSAIHGESEEEGRRESEKEWESEGGASAWARFSQSEERRG